MKRRRHEIRSCVSSTVNVSQDCVCSGRPVLETVLESSVVEWVRSFVIRLESRCGCMLDADLVDGMVSVNYPRERVFFLDYDYLDVDAGSCRISGEKQCYHLTKSSWNTMLTLGFEKTFYHVYHDVIAGIIIYEGEKLRKRDVTTKHHRKCTNILITYIISIETRGEDFESNVEWKRRDQVTDNTEQSREQAAEKRATVSRMRKNRPRRLSLTNHPGEFPPPRAASFYIPSCIMVFVYIRIYFAAKARARRGIRKQPRPRAVVPPESPDVRQTSFTQSTPATESKKPPGSAMENVATIENQPVQIPIVTCDFASDVSTSEADPGGGSSIPMEEKDTLKVTVPVPVQKSSLKATLSVNGDGQSSVPSRGRAPSVGIDVDMVSEFDPSSSDSGVVSRCAVVKPLKIRLCQPIFGRKNLGKFRREHGDGGRTSGKDEAGVEGKSSKPRDPEREKRRLARKKEKRATLILGFIMGSFIACWLPFFVLYIAKPLFPRVEIPGQAFVIVFWLGYMNSALNPFIYTIFNKDFRRAFRRILFK
ncbi:hypothetical protein E2986_12974 [Frieseomelitta varia]|uniref:G-protein coupled receptors family 1 profile domain-containing protein n=1 Tax=Frieseomelitta varia TaxID=561572 RepID=A0A833WA49_9HYME|nr:hypothetical protein E2986_12974 [Frieseomelitta varia]